MKKQLITWFYPIWETIVFVVIEGALFWAGTILLEKVLVAIILIVSEVPIFLNKKRFISQTAGEMDAFVFYVLGVLGAGFALLAKAYELGSVNMGMAIGLALAFLVYFKTITIHSYMQVMNYN